MAWGYWNAHSLAPAALGRHGPGPTLHVLRSREHSLDRDRREQVAAPLSARVSSCSTPAATTASSLNHLGEPTVNAAAVTNAELRDWPGGGGGGGGGGSSRTTSERNTLPRGKTPDSDDWLAERHTLPRGKSDSETVAASGPWAIPKVRSEGEEEEWCPACSSGSRVSFQDGGSSGGADTEPSIAKRKNVGGGGAGSGGSTELLSTSLPTPPPPPFQAGGSSYRHTVLYEQCRICHSFKKFSTDFAVCD